VGGGEGKARRMGAGKRTDERAKENKQTNKTMSSCIQCWKFGSILAIRKLLIFVFCF